jgi:hypothetical protein
MRGAQSAFNYNVNKVQRLRMFTVNRQQMMASKVDWNSREMRTNLSYEVSFNTFIVRGGVEAAITERGAKRH